MLKKLPAHELLVSLIEHYAEQKQRAQRAKDTIDETFLIKVTACIQGYTQVLRDMEMKNAAHLYWVALRLSLVQHVDPCLPEAIKEIRKYAAALEAKGAD